MIDCKKILNEKNEYIIIPDDIAQAAEALTRCELMGLRQRFEGDDDELRRIWALREYEGRVARAAYARQLAATLAPKPIEVSTILEDYDARNASILIKQAYCERLRRVNCTWCETHSIVHAIEMAGKWLVNANRRKGLIIAGGCGVGKTTLAQAIADVLRDYAKQPCVQWQTTDLVTLATNNFEAFREAWQRRIILLDDLGEEPNVVHQYGNENVPMIDFFNARYVRRAPLIITTNLTTDEISTRYGERVADRLREMCDVYDFGDSAVSYRKM